MSELSWGDRAQRAIARVISDYCLEKDIRVVRLWLAGTEILLECKPLEPFTLEQQQKIRSLLRAAYPFGERKHHPYKMWMREVRRALGVAPVQHKKSRQNHDQHRLPSGNGAPWSITTGKKEG